MEGGRVPASVMSDLAVGTAVAGFRIESLIGQGSMGTVYSANDVSLDRRVAIKVLAPELSRDERFRERFLRESRLAASLEHPNIVPIHAAGEADGLLYLAMRYVDGRDLASLLRSLGRLDAERAVDIVAQIGGALDAAHGKGLIHRDVKPANILLARHDGTRDHAYLCDFGLAKHASTVSSLTGDRGIVGTVEYLAPEQIEGRLVDGRVDVYALGCVLYELLTGEAPFNRGNELVALLAHVNDPPPKVSERRSDIPDAFDDVIATALAKDRDLRYASCADLVEAARAALRGERTGAPAAPEPEAAAVRTFLFADVRGYTAYTREHGDEAGAELARSFAALVSELAPQHRGALQELRGDEALVVFDSARAALRFALALQVAVAAADGLARPVGIGLDAGEAVAVEDGFRGGALNRAARLCALAGPGDVLASDAVRELAGQTDGVVYGFRREERLKGFEKPVGVVEIHSTQAAPGRELGRSVRRTLLGTRPRRRIVVALAGLLAVAAALGVVLTRQGSSRAETFPIGSLGIVDPATGKPVGSLNPGSSEVDILIKDGSNLWAFSGGNGLFLQQLDMEHRAVLQQVPLDHGPYVIAPHSAFGSIWLTWNDGDKPQLVRFDPKFARVTARIDLPLPANPAAAQAEGLAITRDAVWVAYGSPKRLARVDPRTNKVTRVVSPPNAPALGDVLLAAGDGELWAVERFGRSIVRLDPETGEVLAHGKLHNGWVEDAAVAGGALWVPMQNDGGVWQLDKSGSVVGKVVTGAVPWALGVDGSDVYVSNQNAGTVTRISALTGATRQFAVGHRPLALTVRKGKLWVFLGQSASDARARITGSRVVEAVVPGEPFGSIDPANLNGVETSLLQYAVGLRLMDQRLGADGTTELYASGAAAPPVVSNGRRTFSFTVRPGFRYSPPSSEPVTAADWKFSIERALSPVYGDSNTGYCQYVMGDLVGEDAYVARRADHISGIAVAGSRISFTLTKPSSTFPARLASACFTSVPLGTPTVAGGVQQPISSAGPYYVDSHIPEQQLVLLKNPNYPGPRRQDVDAVVFRLGFDPAQAASLVASGKADYTFAPGGSDIAPSMVAGGLYARTVGPSAGKGQRYFQIPTSGINFLRLNTSRGPLRDVRLRRAVALAVDRAGVARLEGGAAVAARLITPGVPGYTLRQTVPGPDSLARARTLLGHRRVRLVLYTYPGGKNVNLQRAQVVRDSLAKAGFDVAVRISQDPWGVARRGATQVDMILEGWIPDFIDPEGIINVLLDPTSAAAPFGSDAPWVGRMRAVSKVQGAARPAAYRQLDRELALGPVPAVPLSFSAGSPQLFSSRIGCHSFVPQFYGLVDFASLCLK
jgi:ABC-type transport system substrate-binding protein/class 3 adenylate cyclase/tRNA A-37 threonylcarbamoyl transferase component Bud32/streptogramin lyase